MHNDRMTAHAFRPAGRQTLGLALASLLLLAGCASDEDEGAEGESPTGSTSSAAEEPYLPVPDGVELTAQGSELDLGDTATVAYEPRQDEVAALELKVTRLEKASFKLFVGWKLSPETLETTPYFVHAKVQNVGTTDLGGSRVPLYAVDGENKLVESSTFASTFKPCPSASLPKRFKKGDSTKTCLVYLAPDKGTVEAVSFRPTEEFSPITWTGDVTRPAALQKDEPGKASGDEKPGDKKSGDQKSGDKKSGDKKQG